MSNSEILSKPVSALAEEAGGEFATGFKTAPNLFVVPEEENDEELRPGQGSAYDLSCANTFNSVALPAGFERLNMNRLLGGNMRMDFSTNGIGGITELNGIKFGKDGEPEEEEEEKAEKLRDAMEVAGSIANPDSLSSYTHQQAVAKFSTMSEEEWDNYNFRVGSKSFNGQIFDQLSKFFKSKENKEDTINAMMIRFGMERKEAEEATTKAARFVELQQKLRDGSISAQEFEEHKSLSKDEDVGLAVEISNQIREARANNDHDQQVAPRFENIEVSNSYEIIRNDVVTNNDLSSSEIFKSAPPLTTAFNNPAQGVEVAQNITPVNQRVLSPETQPELAI